MKRKDTMNNIFKKSLCVLMAVLLLIAPITTNAKVNAATDFSYPEGVPAAKAEEIISSTDALLQKAVQTMNDQSLADTVMPMLYESNLLSSLLVGIYTALSSPDMAEMLTTLSVTTSTTELSAVLFAYPEVSAALASASSWDTVDLTDVSWNIHNKNDFALAFGTVLSPLHALLQFLLCEGSFNIVGNLIKYTGGNGYETAVVPIFEAFGCTEYPDYATFKAQSTVNAQTIGANLILPLINYIEKILSSPLSNLCAVLPNLANFILNDGFEKAINALLQPITELAATIEKIPLLNSILAGSNFSDLSTDFAGNLIPDLNTMLSDSGLTLPEIDWELIRSCGTANGDKIIADKGKTFVVIFRWLWEVLQNNSDALGDMLAENTADTTDGMVGVDFGTVLNEFLKDDADTVLRALAFMLKPDLEPFDMYWSFGKTATTEYNFTQEMPRENYTKMMAGFDNLLGALISEMSGAASLLESIRNMLYTNDNITAILKTVYSLFENEEMAPIISLIGIAAEPKEVLSQINDEKYKSAVLFLTRFNTWEEVPADGISWGFANGDREGFTNACAAVLRPLSDLFAFLLAGEDYVFLDSITICGGNGYNGAIIPLFEALGIDPSLYVSFAEYKTTANTDALLTNILNPIFTQIENICASPVDYLTTQLPTISYFISDGGIQKMLYALAAPLLTFVAGSGLSIDLMSVIEDIAAFDLTFGKDQVNKLMADLKNNENGIGIALPELPALTDLASLGTLKEVSSKRTFDGKATTCMVVEADEESVLAYLVDFIVSLMQMPENAEMLTGSFMGDAAADASNPMASYTESFSAELEGMSHTDMVKWFYDMIVIEADASEETVSIPDAVPHIIYEDTEEKSNTGSILIVFFAAAGISVAVFILAKSKKKSRKSKKNKTED